MLGRLRLLAGDRVTACVGAGRAVSDLPVRIGGRSLICVAVLSRRVRGALPVHVAVGIFRDRAAALHRAVFTGGLKRALVRNTAAGGGAVKIERMREPALWPSDWVPLSTVMKITEAATRISAAQNQKNILAKMLRRITQFLRCSSSRCREYCECAQCHLLPAQVFCGDC